MTSIRESAESEKKQLGWSGTNNDLQRLARAVKSLCKRREDEAIAGVQVGGQFRRELAIEKAQKDWAVEAVAVYRGNKRHLAGPVDAVLHDLDTRDLLGLTIRTATGEYSEDHVAVSFNQADVALRIRSTDVAWLNTFEANLIGELEKNRPWWRLLRTKTAGALYVALWVAACVGVIAWLFGSWSKPGSVYGNATWGFWAGILTYVGVRRLLPAFDLSSPDRSGVTTRRLGAAAIVLLPVVLCVASILVPLAVA